MIKILFICHGNICRSSAAEFMFKQLIKDKKLTKVFCCDSAATSYEEIGNDTYPPMKRVLLENNIDLTRHYARRMTVEDYNTSDLILCMDEENMYGINRIIGVDKDKKVYILPRYVNVNYDEIEDPWYSGRYELVYSQFYECLNLLINKLLNKHS